MSLKNLVVSGDEERRLLKEAGQPLTVVRPPDVDRLGRRWIPNQKAIMTTEAIQEGLYGQSGIILGTVLQIDRMGHLVIQRKGMKSPSHYTPELWEPR